MELTIEQLRQMCQQLNPEMTDEEFYQTLEQYQELQKRHQRHLNN